MANAKRLPKRATVPPLSPSAGRLSQSGFLNRICFEKCFGDIRLARCAASSRPCSQQSGQLRSELRSGPRKAAFGVSTSRQLFKRAASLEPRRRQSECREPGPPQLQSAFKAAVQSAPNPAEKAARSCVLLRAFRAENKKRRVAIELCRGSKPQHC